MNWLKKGPVLATLTALLLLWAGVVFFFDPLLKRALIAGGQAAAGAKVDIGFLRSRWLKGTLEIGRVAVADREQTMRNLVEFSRADLRLDISAALRGKVVVRTASLEGLRLNTARARDGALPNPPPPSALSLAIRKQIAPVSDAALAQVDQTRSNVSTEIDAAKLASLRKLDEAKAKAADIEQRWKGKAEEANAIEKDARDIAEQLKSLGSSGDLLKKMSETQRAQQRIKALMARIDSQKTEAQSDLASAQALLKEAEELRKQDLNGLLASAGLPTLDSADLARRLLGQQTAARLSTALKWMKLAREKAAARGAAAPPPPPRRKGVDVEFPRAHAYPQFLLEDARLAGTLDGMSSGALDLSGLLNGVTSNPKLYAKPATLSLSGRSAAGPAVTLNARLDQHKDPVGVSIEVDGSGFSLAGAALGDASVGGLVKNGVAAVKGRLSCAAENWTGEFLVSATGVELEPRISLTGPAAALVGDAFKSLSAFTVRVGVSGKEDDLKLSFSSNIGDVVAAAMKKSFSAQLEAQRKVLEAKLAAAYGDKFKDARARADALTAQLLGPLDAQKNALQKQLQETIGKAVGGQPLRFDKLFK
ncbi:MAG: TIGR03545 family protein [Elusimicrobiota bacterium]